MPADNQDAALDAEAQAKAISYSEEVFEREKAAGVRARETVRRSLALWALDAFDRTISRLRKPDYDKNLQSTIAIVLAPIEAFKNLLKLLIREKKEGVSSGPANSAQVQATPAKDQKIASNNAQNVEKPAIENQPTKAELAQPNDKTNLPQDQKIASNNAQNVEKPALEIQPIDAEFTILEDKDSLSQDQQLSSNHAQDLETHAIAYPIIEAEFIKFDENYTPDFKSEALHVRVRSAEVKSI